MDFPAFFRTALNWSKIKSDRWRGLALQTKRPPFLLGEELSAGFRRGNVDDIIQSSTGTGFKDRDQAIHVINKPMIYTQTTGPNSAQIPIVPGMACFIHSVAISEQMVAADTGTMVGIRFWSLGVNQYLIIPTVTLTAGTRDLTHILDVQCDPETSVAVTAVGTYTTFAVSIAYHMVGMS